MADEELQQVPEQGQTAEESGDEFASLTEEQLREALRREREQREHLERKLGEQGRELGFLRQRVEAILSAAATPQTPPETPKSAYKPIGEKLLLEPDEAVEELATRVKEETLAAVRGELAKTLTLKELVDRFYDANPDLKEWRDVVAVIGQSIQAQNPHAPVEQVLEETARQTREWIAQASQRLQGRRVDAAKKLAAATTSGGPARETAPALGQTTGAAKKPMDPEQAAVLEAIEELRAYRSKRMQPPRSRSG